MFRRDIKSLSEILQQCLRQDGLETPLLQKRLIESWDKVAGYGISKYTGDKYIRNQTLFVKINNPSLRADLTMIRSRLVRSLNAEVGSNVIIDIRFY